MKYFPIFLNLEEKTAVLYGGGADAAAKLRLLQKTEAELLVIAPCLDLHVLTLGNATWVQSDPLTFELPENTALVYAATGDEDLDAALVARAQSKGVLACAVDQPGPSDFITPAVVDRDPIVVAIGTQGTAPVLARDIKSKIETLLEPSLGTVAQVAARLRPLVAKVAAAGGQRRAFWHDFFTRARAQPSRAREIGHLLLANLKHEHARLSYIDAPTGQASLCAASREALHTADLVIYDADVAPAVLELARREAIQIRRENLGRHHVPEALSENHHVVLLRRQPGHDELSEIAAGFGVVAQVYPAASVRPGPTHIPLANAA